MPAFGQAQLYLAAAYHALGVHVSDDDRTPWRVAKWLESFAGLPDHSTDLPEEITRAIQVDNHDELVLVKDIEFTALCEHHFLPFTGRAAVGYIPQGRMIGLSKLARIVHHYTRFPTLQEHITTHIADALEANLTPLGAMVVLYNVAHTCMSSRGVKEHDASTATSAVRGVFRTEVSARHEFLSLI
jgi:GTP cyclohydrolase I